MDLYIILKDVPEDPEIACEPVHEFEGGSRRPRKTDGPAYDV
jgi:hypothetical protein